MDESLKEEKDEVLKEFTNNVSAFLNATTGQRARMHTAFCYYDGHHYTQDIIKERVGKNKLNSTINLSSPLINAVAGSEVLSDSKLDIISMDEDMDEEADVMSDGVEFCRYASGDDSQTSAGYKDALIAGLGAKVIGLSMSEKNFPVGLPDSQHVHVLFAFWDRSVRNRDLNKYGRYCGYGDPILKQDLDEYLESILGGEEYSAGSSPFDLQFFNHIQNTDLGTLEMIYHYFWYEYEDIHDVKNPIKDPAIVEVLQPNPTALKNFEDAVTAMRVDVSSEYWSLDKEQYKSINETLEAIFFALDLPYTKMKSSKRKCKCYYRAEIARNMVIRYSKSFTDKGHPMVFYQGRYDQTLGEYYGLMRPLSEVQDALNIAVSDFMAYAQDVTSGGGAYVKGAGEAAEKIIKDKAIRDKVTFLPSSTEIVAKAQPNSPEVLTGFISLMIDLLPKTVGLTQEFMGVVTSGDMTDSLYGSVMRQSYAVLADFANSSSGAAKRTGEIFIDLVRLMAEANNGQVLPLLSPQNTGNDKIRLYKDSIGAAYAIRVAQRPMTADEKKDAFLKLSQLAQNSTPEVQQMIMPIAIKYAPIDTQDRKEIEAMLQPKPPMPDPMNEAMVKANLELLTADANLKNATAEEKRSTIQLKPEELMSVIDKNKAQALNYLQ